MKAIVTGGAGFIGSHIAERLLKDGHEVLIFDDLSSGKEENIPEGADFEVCDISDQDDYYDFIEGTDVIFHNAASKKNICLKDPVRDLEVNGAGTLQLLECAREFGVEKFVHASTGSVYGRMKNYPVTEESYLNPVSYYGISKLTGENYVRYYSQWIDTTILRYFHVYGDRQEDDPELGGVVAIFTNQIKNGRPITIHGSGDQQRVFTHVDDVVEANIQAWQQEKAQGKIYNCASNKQTTVGELADKLMEKYGDVERRYTDALEGDIFWFDVDSSKIGELGVTFRDYE